MRALILMLLLVVAAISYADSKEIAITIDDLPLVASRMNSPSNQQRSEERFKKIIEAFKTYQVPAVGFVIGGAIEKGQWAFLEEFRQAGLMLGNHTYTHHALNQLGADKYIADIARADTLLTPLMTEPKYFRYPYLAEGTGSAKQKVLNYLNEHHYTVAPVTIDSKDFQFNEELYKVPFRARENYTLTRMKPRYLDYVWKQTLRAEKRSNGKPVKQILLIHANLLNSYLLGDLLEMYKQNGYKFISLTEALKNPAPVISVPITESANQDKAQPSFLPEGQ